MTNPQKVRLDKWLWAARFFKTRSLAKKAIEGGKVAYDGARAKVSKEVSIGATLTIPQGWDEKTVHVDALSEQRRGAEQAALLYTETPESIERRKQQAAQRKVLRESMLPPETRPTKKQRRELGRLREQDYD
ncbi:MAG: ribosome-associated heat shock protein Hsp15 [Pseudomonadales bacterium]